MDAELTRRRLQFAPYITRSDMDGKTGRKLARFACPSCGYPTLGERSMYEICILCGWEDDGQDDPDADAVWGGPNGHYSLTQARQNFQHHWCMYDPDDKRCDDTPAEFEAKQAMARAFDAMQAADQDGWAALWEQVSESERTLNREMNRRLAEHKRRAPRQTDKEENAP